MIEQVSDQSEVAAQQFLFAKQLDYKKRSY